MAKWSNPKLVLYHGTDDLGANALLGIGRSPLAVDLTLCKSFTDFGQGFYTTTWLHQAKQWANMKVLRQPKRLGRRRAQVIKFDIDRDWLASLDSLVFVRATDDFWDLVASCRNGDAPHGRNAPHSLPYDVVYGPVTILGQKLLIANGEQISFHTTRAASGLGLPSQVDEGDPTTGLFL